MAALSVNNHDRDSAGLTYVYPVLSRRAGGLSIGVNFNINNACNWRCIYCQVPDLSRGGPPALDVALLAAELRGLLADVASGEFYRRFDLRPEQFPLRDIAISGNGEPTSAAEFPEAVSLIGDIGRESGLFPGCNLVLISNGSLVNQVRVQQGLRVLAEFGGEMWFKVDSARAAGRRLLNDAPSSDAGLARRIEIAAGLCRVKLQTCMLSYRDFAWDETEQAAYLALLRRMLNDGVVIEQVLLYGLARESRQPEAGELVRVGVDEMRAFAARIEALGVGVRVSG